jgi:hypothetical protein
MLWLPPGEPLQLRIGAYVEEEEREEHEVPVPPGVQLSVTAHAHKKSRSDVSPPRTFMLHASVESSGRPLTAAEVEAALAPFSMLPADKGGGTGLGLFGACGVRHIAVRLRTPAARLAHGFLLSVPVLTPCPRASGAVLRGMAAALGGELRVPTPRTEGTLLELRVPLRVADDTAMPEFRADATEEAAQEATQEAAQAACAVPSPPRTAPPPLDTEELTLTSRMFECLLANSDDVFAICSVTPPDPAEPDGELRVVVTYVSPSVAWRLAFQQADVVGRNLLDVCHPEDRTAFMSALQAAYASASDGHVNYVHRNVSASGGDIWCHTSGFCKGDQLFVVCRDMRTLASVELALRAFTLALSHDMREPCNTILMAASVLERRPCVVAHEDVSDLAETIRSACGLLLGIVGNVLTTPQVEAGLLTAQLGVFSPVGVVADVLRACRTGCAAARGGTRITLEAARDDELPVLVEGDRHRVAQARGAASVGICDACRSFVSRMTSHVSF